MLTKYLIIAIIVSCLVGGVSAKLYVDEKAAHAVTEQSLLVSKEQLTVYVGQVNALNIAQRALQEVNKEVLLENRNSARTLDGLRNREATVIAKKSLVSLRINKAFQKRQKSLACITGDFALCEE